MRRKSCQQKWKRELFVRQFTRRKNQKQHSEIFGIIRVPTFCACLGKPRAKLQLWNFDPSPSESCNGRTRNYKDKQYMQRIEDFSRWSLEWWFSTILAVPWRSLRDHLLDLTSTTFLPVLSCPKSAGQSHERRGVWLPGQVWSSHRERQESVYKFSLRDVHGTVVWFMASSRMSKLQVWIGMRIRRLFSVWTHRDWWAAWKECKKSGGKGSVTLLKEFVQVGSVSQDYHPRKSILREVGKLGSNHTIKFSKGTWPHIKIGERKGPSQGIMHMCNPQERDPCAPKFQERTQEKTFHSERCARREHVTWRNMSTSWKMRTWLCFTLFPKHE